VTTVARGLLLLAVALLLAGHFQSALFVAIAAGGLAIGGPTDEQQDARRRNPPVRQARRVR
jgi:hypothetical protein